jgi:hypothetical protein
MAHQPRAAGRRLRAGRRRRVSRQAAVARCRSPPRCGGFGYRADAAAARAPRAGELAVVEALVNPAGQDLGREWIEIVSLAAEPLDLSALHVADAAVDVAAPAGSSRPAAASSPVNPPTPR